MKERLDQLRAMDSAAFMALPASSFSPMPKEAAFDPEEIAAVSSPYTNLNGHIPHAEGERRRKEMLDVATMLEERYRVLLPPDRVRRAQEPVLSESTSRTQVLSRDGDDSETDQASVIEEKLRLRLPARSSASTTSAPSPVATTPTIKKPRFNASSKQSSVIRILRTAVTTPSSPPTTLPHAEASPLSPSPTIDMDIPPSPSPEELEPTPSSPLSTLATVLPQTPISNEASMIEPSSPGAPLSNRAAMALGIVLERNYTFPEQESLFTPPGQEMPLTPSDEEMPATPADKEMPATPPDQEMPATLPDQEMLIASNGQERSPTPSDQERPIIPEPEEAPILQSQERSIHYQEIMLLAPPEQERISTPEQRRPSSPEPESPIAQDQERVSSPSPPVPDRLSTPLEQEKLITPEYRRSPTPLVRERSVSVIPEQEPPPEEERPVTPERFPTPPTTTLVPERVPTPPAPERPITLVEVADQGSLPEKEPSTHELRMAEDGEFEKAETEDEMSVRAESEVPAPQNEPEREEVDIESGADKMDVEQEGPVEPVGPVGPIPTVAAIEQAAVADLAIPEATLIERTILQDVPQVSVDSDPTVIEQADVPTSLDRPVTPEQSPHTESIDIEVMPISSISVSRNRGRKRPRLDSSIQNETVSAPVRGPRVPKNHVTFRGASGEMEVTASAIVKAAVHRTQRDVTRHLNAFGVPVPNAIVQMGPPFELPEWVFPPLSPAESEHAHGDFDVDIEEFELNPRTPSKQQVTPPALNEPDHSASIEVDRVEQPILLEQPILEQPILEQPIQRHSGPKIIIPWLPPQPRAPEPVYEEDTVSLGDEDT